MFFNDVPHVAQRKHSACNDLLLMRTKTPLCKGNPSQWEGGNQLDNLHNESFAFRANVLGVGRIDCGLRRCFGHFDLFDWTLTLATVTTLSIVEARCLIWCFAFLHLFVVNHLVNGRLLVDWCIGTHEVDAEHVSSVSSVPSINLFLPSGTCVQQLGVSTERLFNVLLRVQVDW